MKENSDLNSKSKYIIGILVVVLLIITIISVNQLFNSKLNNDLLKIQNDKLSIEQKKQEFIIHIQSDSLEIFKKEIVKIKKRRSERKDVIIKLNKEEYENIKRIISDDAITDANAIANTFRTFNSN